MVKAKRLTGYKLREAVTRAENEAMHGVVRNVAMFTLEQHSNMRIALDFEWRVGGAHAMVLLWKDGNLYFADANGTGEFRERSVSAPLGVGPARYLCAMA